MRVRLILSRYSDSPIFGAGMIGARRQPAINFMLASLPWGLGFSRTGRRPAAARRAGGASL